MISKVVSNISELKYFLKIYWLFTHFHKNAWLQLPFIHKTISTLYLHVKFCLGYVHIVLYNSKLAIKGQMKSHSQKNNS